MPTRRKSRAASKKPDTSRGAKKVKTEEKEEEKEVNDEEVTEDESSETEKEETDDEERGRGKRKRRESKSYEPDDFTLVQFNNAMKAAAIAEGRGKKLGDIAAAKNCMKKFTLNSEEFVYAYKFLFSNRGIANKKLMKEKLLAFSGYLPPLPKGKYDEEKQDEEDEVIETKYAIKTFKMNLSQIKMLCDFFNVDNFHEDGKFLNKDDMIDRLLDFLGAPDESSMRGKMTSEPKKKTTPAKAKKTEPKPKTVVKTVVKTVKVDPYNLIKDYKKGKSPNDEELRQWVKAYIACSDMDTATTKDAIRTASAKFGVDLTNRKGRIKEFLAEEI
mmetsp:Transcript_24780/g.58157  ORF Transcript_24780/g.58157 Transcript_24780/m.58157 type:complete len:329 (+) Transcript_24780:113-1099(+)|eukprot:CAMPEP_0197188922 /NCGR_PEP_ID=MMETSP1423-20130617/18780_1 /TAXON_ID=476441 /ORGANISM="Pseudo-nitzschia heimii, Strain UNC1101" /LENGTH=328 /DNA_ID=CAMNT_0042640905 /DNA_START=40 /DNA_END=1026 /DNA_ORIENTATION=+